MSGTHFAEFLYSFIAISNCLISSADGYGSSGVSDKFANFAEEHNAALVINVNAIAALYCTSNCHLFPLLSKINLND